jgi:uncharacterized protein (DUF305 family)
MPRSRRTQIVAATVAVVLLVLLGYVGGLLTGRPSYPGEASAEAGFARDMSAHHAQAVEMAMIAYQKGSSEHVRSLGGDVAVTQQGQVGVMQTWLKTWGLGPNSSQRPMAWMPGGPATLKGNLMPGMATREEVNTLGSATGKDVDILFCQYMHRHHLGGIHMAEGVLKLTSRPEVRELAEAMKRNQGFEVTLLEQILTTLGAKPLV